MIERIAKLIALAENASTVAEAEAAFAKAQELATRHAIDLEVARRAAAPKQRETPTQRNIRVGEKGKHANKPLINLYSRIADSNDVTILIARDSTYIIGHGMPSDLDAVDALWVSLATTMTRFADALVRDKNAEWRTETVQVWNEREWRYEDKPVSGQGARRSFCDGFIQRIGERLRDARKAAVAEADTHFHHDATVAVTGGADNVPSSMALVLKEKKVEVESYMWSQYEQKYGRKRPRGGWNGGSNATGSYSARSAGSRAADHVNLSGRRGISA